MRRNEEHAIDWPQFVWTKGLFLLLCVSYFNPILLQSLTISACWSLIFAYQNHLLLKSGVHSVQLGGPSSSLAEHRSRQATAEVRSLRGSERSKQDRVCSVEQKDVCDGRLKGTSKGGLLIKDFQKPLSLGYTQEAFSLAR